MILERFLLAIIFIVIASAWLVKAQLASQSDNVIMNITLVPIGGGGNVTSTTVYGSIHLGEWLAGVGSSGNHRFGFFTTTNKTLVVINASLDVTPPNVTIVFPSVDSFLDSTFNIRFQVNDTSGISQCSIVSGVLGTTANNTALNVSNELENNKIYVTTLQPGNQVSFLINCTDWAGNVAASPIRIFTISKITAPTADGGQFPHIGQVAKKECEIGQQFFISNGTQYCVNCNGTLAYVAFNEKLYCIESIKQTGSKGSMAPMMVLLILTLLTYAISKLPFGENSEEEGGEDENE